MPCRYEFVGMFHGSTPYGALSVTEGSSSSRLISGEKSNTPSGIGNPRSALVEDAAREPATARIARDEDGMAVSGAVRGGVERGQNVERVVQRGGVRELGREPVVGDEDLAAGRPREPCREQRVHVRRRADVAAAVEVQHPGARCRVARPGPQAGHARRSGRAAP